MPPLWLSAFAGLRISFAGEPQLWKVIYDTDDAHTCPLPGEWQEKLDIFKRMLVLRCLRPDKLELAVQRYIINMMGADYVKPPSFNLKACFDESAPTLPLVFVLSAGADPMTNLLKLSSDMKMQVDSVSLGQGQGPKAERLMEMGKANGTWVCLQNAHLAVSWLPTLERICEQTTEDDCHRDYRLWIDLSIERFSVSILQNAVKMTLGQGNACEHPGLVHERPHIGLPFSVKRSRLPPYAVSMLLPCQHSLERREFSALGWNNPYVQQFRFAHLHQTACRVSGPIPGYLQAELLLRAVQLQWTCDG